MYNLIKGSLLETENVIQNTSKKSKYSATRARQKRVNKSCWRPYNLTTGSSLCSSFLVYSNPLSTTIN